MNKKNLIIIASVAAVIIATALLYYKGYILRKENGLSPEEMQERQRQLIEKTTAPSNKEVAAPKEVTDKLTAPKKSAPVSAEVIDKLSAPTK